MVESKGLFLVKSHQEKEREKKSSNCSPLNIPENFTGLIIDRKGRKLYKNFLPLTAI